MSHVSKKKIKKERKRIKRKKKESQKGKMKEEMGSEGHEGGEERERERGKMIFSLLSKIYGNRIIGFHRSKRQSRSTPQELHVGTKILEFRQIL